MDASSPRPGMSDAGTGRHGNSRAKGLFV